MSVYKGKTETETETETETLPVMAGPPLTSAKLDNFKKLAAETSAGGALIKFNKGEWFAGDDVINGERRIAHIDQLARGWIKFGDGKKVDQRIGKVADGFEMPERSSLGDADQCNWDTDSTGSKRDPWQRQYFLPLRDPETNAVAVYVTGSVGGISTIGALSQVFSENAQNGLPIVRLAVGSYKHREYGRVQVPDLQVVAFTGREAIADDLVDHIPF